MLLLLWLLLLETETHAAAESVGGAIRTTKVNALDSPLFYADKGLSPLSRIIYILAIAGTLLFSVVPKKKLAKYQMGLLSALGLAIGVFDVFLSLVMGSSVKIMLPLVVIGFFLSLLKQTKLLVMPLAPIHGTAIMIASISCMQIWTTYILLMFLCGVGFYVLEQISVPLFKVGLRIAMQSFLICCLLGLTIMDVLKNGLTYDVVSTLTLLERFSRFIIILIVIFVTFITPVVSYLSERIFGVKMEGESEKVKEREVVI